MNSANRVIVNTAFLYANMVVSLCVQLVSVRILLQAMGVVDYGIYNVVAGIVAMFSFMNVAMAASTQRFLSYAIGEGDRARLSELFYQSVILHLVIGLLFVSALELGGQYYVHHILRAPAERILAATLLLHCIAASTFVNIITVPYEADINANEDMGVIAAINIFEALMKLGTALFVLYTPNDKLVTFGVLTMLCLITSLTLKRIYCVRHYEESRIKWHRIQSYEQMRGVVSFAGWNLIGAGCGIARYQGTALILNAFFGIVVNAAYGVAQQVNGLLLFFANTIVRAIRPQVVKSEGAGDRQRMLRLSVTTCKITSLMVAFMAIPLFVEMPFILRFWLGQIPGQESIMFCRCFLVIVFLNQLTIGLQIAIESTGNIRRLQTIVGTMHLMALPLGYICFRMGLPVSSIMFCIIGEEVLALFVRTLIAHHQVGLSVRQFLLCNVVPCLLAVALVSAVSHFPGHLVPTDSWAHVITTTLTSTLLLTLLGRFFLLSSQENRVITSFVGAIGNKIRRKNQS